MKKEMLPKSLVVSLITIFLISLALGTVSAQEIDEESSSWWEAVLGFFGGLFVWGQNNVENAGSEETDYYNTLLYECEATCDGYCTEEKGIAECIFPEEESHPERPCAVSANCPPGQGCAEGICQEIPDEEDYGKESHETLCTLNTICPSGQGCAEGICQDLPVRDDENTNPDESANPDGKDYGKESYEDISDENELETPVEEPEEYYDCNEDEIYVEIAEGGYCEPKDSGILPTKKDFNLFKSLGQFFKKLFGSE